LRGVYKKLFCGKGFPGHNDGFWFGSAFRHAVRLATTEPGGETWY
jgi:hypothetical protein